MLYTRRHSNGFQVVIDEHVFQPGWWVIYSLSDQEFVGLMASSLDEAKDIAHSLAVVSHLDECDDNCKDWVTCQFDES
jgi:hypothetical protein